jgi:flagellar assembly protein FliH
LSETMVLPHRGKRGIRFVRMAADAMSDSAATARETMGGDKNWTPLGESPQAAPPDLLEEAYCRGVAEGRKAAQEELALARKTQEDVEKRGAEALARSVQTQFNALLTRVETDALRFALAVAERIVKREVRMDKEVVVRQIREAVKRIVGTDSIKLRVHPDDESIARHHRSAILASLESVREVIIEADTSVERGGCIIESTSGNVDARMETQLRQVDAAVFGSSGQEGKRKR